jgi:hypothetical protein
MPRIDSYRFQMRQQARLLTRPQQLWPTNHVPGPTKEQRRDINRDVLLRDGHIRDILLALHHGDIPVLRRLEAISLHPGDELVAHFVSGVGFDGLAAVFLEEVFDAVFFAEGLEPSFGLAVADCEEGFGVGVQ